MSQLGYEQLPNNSANAQYIALKQMLDRPEATTCLDEACEMFTIQPGMGNAVNLRRWTNPDADSTTNDAGNTKASRRLDYTDFTGTVHRYCENFTTTTYNKALNPYDAVKGAADVLGSWQIPETRELIRWNAAKGITSVMYNSPAISTRITVNGVLTGGRLQKAGMQIDSYRGRPFSNDEGGANKEGTSPVEAAFYVYCHTDLKPDIRNLPGFIPVAQYPSGKGKRNEFGAWQNFRFFCAATYAAYANAATSVSSSTLIATGATGTTAAVPDVYPVVVLAKGALASVAFKGGGAEGFGNADVNILDKADKSDPNNDRQVVAASWFDLCMVVSNQWGSVIEVAATRNPT
jgi:N4-gp56 family major capsid protein